MTYDEYKKLGKKPVEMIVTWSIVAGIGLLVMIVVKLCIQTKSSSADYIKID
jgi:hypothetical protein